MPKYTFLVKNVYNNTSYTPGMDLFKLLHLKKREYIGLVIRVYVKFIF